MNTRIAAAGDPAAISSAVDLLARGEPVALPTETVYGLAADATRPGAVLKIFEAKERPFFDPLIVHLPSRAWLEKIAAIPGEIRPRVEALAEKFWPGPLTIILPRRALIPDVVSAGLQTVAVRMSAHLVFQKIAAQFGRPLAAPSANRFGRISPTCAQHVNAELNSRIPLIVDGGATEHGVESTILRISASEMQILRSGPITPEQLADFGPITFAPASEKPDAPGQLESHYAPRTPLRLDGNARSAGERAGLLAWRAARREASFAATEILSERGDLREAAATLFAKLRRLDEAGLDWILAEPVPETGLGLAIMDRLRKASAGGGRK